LKWHIFAIGKPKLPFAQLGIEEYASRLKKSVQIHFLKSSVTDAEILQKTKGMFRIALDEEGEQLTSIQFAKRITQWENQGRSKAALFIGSADGHSAKLKSKCDMLLSLSAFTLQHELALIVLLEQLYRAYSIQTNLPYHRR
jgi:23S rRNA (pseudouridine1915-N3)-methyltransferase